MVFVLVSGAMVFGSSVIEMSCLKSISSVIVLGFSCSKFCDSSGFLVIYCLV